MSAANDGFGHGEFHLSNLSQTSMMSLLRAFSKMVVMRQILPSQEWLYCQNSLGISSMVQSRNLTLVQIHWACVEKDERKLGRVIWVSDRDFVRLALPY